jgi:twinkle protein
MSCEEKDEAMEFINKHFFWILPENENYTVQNILDAAAYLTLKEGIKSLVIDPWNCLEHNYGQDTETEYTKKTLNKLIYFEREHGLHLFLVVHPAKMRRKASSSQYEIPTLYDCSGSAQFYNKAEIGMTIWREFDRELNQTKYSAVFINKVKHNYMGETGTVKFDFDVKSQRFYEQGVTRYEGSFLDKNYLGLSREQEFWYNQEDDDDKPPF